MDVRFVIVAPPPARKAFKVRLPVVVGRGDEALFRIQQDGVSRQHCTCACNGVAVTVTDLGSTNGTLVSGTRITAQAHVPDVQAGLDAAAVAPAATDTLDDFFKSLS